MPPPKQLRLDLDFAETLNLDFHQLDFSDDSKLQAWTEKNTPKLPMDESCWLSDTRSETESRDRKSVLAPQSVSNGFFESPLSTPTTPSSEWGLGFDGSSNSEQESRDERKRDHRQRPRDQHHQQRDFPPSPQSQYSLRHKPTTNTNTNTNTNANTNANTTTQHKKTTVSVPSREKSLPKQPAAAQRPHMNQSKSCSHLPKRSKSHNAGSTHASQFVKSRVASESHVGYATHASNQGNHVNGHNVGTYGMTNSTNTRHMPNPSVDSFVTCTDVSPRLPSTASPREQHQRNISVASVDTVSGYMDPGLATTISRYYHLEGVSEGVSHDHHNAAAAAPRHSRDFAGSSSYRLSQRHSRDFVSSSGNNNRQSRQSNESPFNTPSLDDRNSSSTFTMSPSTSTTMSTPSLVDSPSSCASVNVSFDKPGSQGGGVQSGHVNMAQTQPLHVTPTVPPPRPFTLYSTDNDLVPPPRSKYRSRHYRFDSSSSSVYSNSYVKEDYMGALRHSLYVSRDDESSSPGIRPVSAFEIPQLSADDYASVIKEGQWF